MKKMIVPFLFVLTFLCFVAAMARILYTENAAQTPPDMQIAVIVYGTDNDDRFAALGAGISQACRELDLETPVISMATSTDPDMQQRLIDRETEGGADGLLIVPEGSEPIAIALEPIYYAHPVVFAINGIPDFDYIAPNSAGMAQLLAEKIPEMEGPVILITENLSRINIQARHDAFTQAMAEMGRDYAILQEITGPIPKGAVIVALDIETMERAIDAFADTDSRLYGIGSSDKVIHALNQGTVNGVIFENDYTTGYTATMQLAAEMGLIREYAASPIQYMYVDRSNMYQPEVERLFFNILQ